MRLTQQKTHWRGPGVLLISAIVQNATERLEKPSSNAAMQLNAKNVLDIFHSAAVLGFHPQEGLFLQTVLKMVELRLQEFSAQVQLGCNRGQSRRLHLPILYLCHAFSHVALADLRAGMIRTLAITDL